MRADAQRNHDAVLAAAKAVFAQAGTDAPMEDVARAAGVGKGTLYRRFPTREHLFAAILQERVDELDASAQRALAAPDVWQALSQWLELYDRCATEYPGMSARVGESLSDGRSAVGTLCSPMRSSFARLFERARQEVPLRPDLTSTQLLSMVSALPKDAATGRTVEPCLRVVLDERGEQAGRRHRDVHAPVLPEQPLVRGVVDPRDHPAHRELRLGQQRHRQVRLVVTGGGDDDVADLEFSFLK